MASISGATIRQVMLEVVNEYSSKGPGYFQQGVMLHEVANRLGAKGNEELARAILSFWNDLFRQGYLGWGHNLDNPDSPFVHLREQGAEALKNLSRDPSNPDGYMQYVNHAVPNMNAVARSYLDEALQTYNSVCYKATAVMIGCATESIILELRDVIIARMKSRNIKVSSKLEDWRIKTVSDAIVQEMDARTAAMPQRLAEAYEGYWTTFTSQIRMSRNDAGHPTALDPLTNFRAQASLLIFPETAKLAYDLIAWVPMSLV